MRAFNVLDASEQLPKHALLEASAGTGKTFAIENLVARAILDGVELEQILVVTFTRAATRELKERIRKRLSSLTLDEAPPYLQVIEDQKLARRRLRRALAHIDQAPIFTIHGFCLRALQQQAGLPEDRIVEPLSRDYLIGVVQDYFRTELNSHLISTSQLSVLFGAFGNQLERLQSRLAQAISGASCIPMPLGFSEIEKEIENALSQISPPEVAQTLILLSPQFKGLHDRQKQLKPDVIAAFDQMRKEPKIDWWLTQGRDLLEKYTEDNRAKRAKITGSIDPSLQKLLGLLQVAMDEEKIFQRIASECQKLLHRVLEKENKLHPDGLLKEVQKKLSDPGFCRSIGQQYRAAVIDEFQDTDGVQWNIFSRLFLDQEHHLYLVGDPKQSIYGFRNADIYTYLKAAGALGENSRFSLDTNYRSTPEVVHGLNQLFQAASDWLALPQAGALIEFEPVKVGVESKEKGLICVPKAESEEVLIHWICQEISSLGCPKECVVLVRDRFQAERMQQALDQWGLKSVLGRCQPIFETDSYTALRDVLRATLHPRSLNRMKIALASPIFGWNSEDLQQLNDIDCLEKTLMQFRTLHHILIENGFSMWCEKVSSLGRVLPDLEQLLDLVMRHQARWQCGPEGVLAYLEDLPNVDLDDCPELARRQVNDDQAVQIMTLHACKGLEFDTVFTLGLTSRSRRRFDVLERGVEEERAEALRLLYVAMTRAKRRLYCPLLTWGRPPREGEYSPMELLENHLDCSFDELGFRTLIIEELPECQRYEYITEPVEQTEGSSTKVPQARYSIDSYTSLHQPHRIHESIDPPGHHPPKGRRTGILLHSLMEELGQIGFGQCSFNWVQKRLEGTLLEPFTDVCHAWIEQTIHTEFGNFRLIDLEPSQVLVETEFLYSTENGFVKGVIDLVVFWEGAIYVFDWKSNCLPDYSTATLKRAMHSEGYDLQVELYSEAVRRWVEEGDLTFAGSYYVFLRGGESLFISPAVEVV